MRYQFPSIKQAIEDFKNENIDEIEVISLYPQHAMSTTLSTALEVKRVVNKYYPELKLNFVEPFYDHPDYIKALSESCLLYTSPSPRDRG